MNPLLILPLAALIGLLAGLLYFAHLRNSIARWATDHASGRLMFGGMVRVIAMVALLVVVTRVGGGLALAAATLGFLVARWLSLRSRCPESGGGLQMACDHTRQRDPRPQTSDPRPGGGCA